MSGRWHNMSATAPLWGTGAILAGLGLVLIVVAYRQVHRGR